MTKNADSDKSFALLSEVKDSAPPRLRLLIPALFIAIAMLTIYTAGVTSLLGTYMDVFTCSKFDGCDIQFFTVYLVVFQRKLTPLHFIF